MNLVPIMYPEMNLNDHLALNGRHHHNGDEHPDHHFADSTMNGSGAGGTVGTTTTNEQQKKNPIEGKNNSDDSSSKGTTTTPSTSTSTTTTTPTTSTTTTTSSSATLLPLDYKLSDDDVICGRGSRCYNHTGNKKFRTIVEQYLDRYSNTVYKFDKTTIICEIVQIVRQNRYNNAILQMSKNGETTTDMNNNERNNNPNHSKIMNSQGVILGGFVKKDPQTGRYYEVGDFLAREKTSQAFRDALQDQYKSSNATKKKKRSLENQIQLNRSLASASLLLNHQNDPSTKNTNTSTSSLSLSMSANNGGNSDFGSNKRSKSGVFNRNQSFSRTNMNSSTTNNSNNAITPNSTFNSSLSCFNFQTGSSNILMQNNQNGQQMNSNFGMNQHNTSINSMRNAEFHVSTNSLVPSSNAVVSTNNLFLGGGGNVGQGGLQRNATFSNFQNNNNNNTINNFNNNNMNSNNNMFMNQSQSSSNFISGSSSSTQYDPTKSGASAQANATFSKSLLALLQQQRQLEQQTQQQQQNMVGSSFNNPSSNSTTTYMNNSYGIEGSIPNNGGIGTNTTATTNTFGSSGSNIGFNPTTNMFLQPKTLVLQQQQQQQLQQQLKLQQQQNGTSTIIQDTDNAEKKNVVTKQINHVTNLIQQHLQQQQQQQQHLQQQQQQQVKNCMQMMTNDQVVGPNLEFDNLQQFLLAQKVNDISNTLIQNNNYHQPNNVQQQQQQLGSSSTIITNTQDMNVQKTNEAAQAVLNPTQLPIMMAAAVLPPNSNPLQPTVPVPAQQQQQQQPGSFLLSSSSSETVTNPLTIPPVLLHNNVDNQWGANMNNNNNNNHNLGSAASHMNEEVDQLDTLEEEIEANLQSFDDFLDSTIQVNASSRNNTGQQNLAHTSTNNHQNHHPSILSIQQPNNNNDFLNGSSLLQSNVISNNCHNNDTVGKHGSSFSSSINDQSKNRFDVVSASCDNDTTLVDPLTLFEEDDGLYDSDMSTFGTIKPGGTRLNNIDNDSDNDSIGTSSLSSSNWSCPSFRGSSSITYKPSQQQKRGLGLEFINENEEWNNSYSNNNIGERRSIQNISSKINQYESSFGTSKTTKMMTTMACGKPNDLLQRLSNKNKERNLDLMSRLQHRTKEISDINTNLLLRTSTTNNDRSNNPSLPMNFLYMDGNSTTNDNNNNHSNELDPNNMNHPGMNMSHTTRKKKKTPQSCPDLNKVTSSSNKKMESFSDMKDTLVEYFSNEDWDVIHCSSLFGSTEKNDINNNLVGNNNNIKNIHDTNNNDHQDLVPSMIHKENQNDVLLLSGGGGNNNNNGVPRILSEISLQTLDEATK